MLTSTYILYIKVNYEIYKIYVLNPTLIIKMKLLTDKKI